MPRNESEVAKDIFLELKRKCKEQKLIVDKMKKKYEDTKSKYYFESEQCIIDSAKEDYLVAKAKLEQLVEDKIMIEKFMRTLRHKENGDTVN